jgi:hypothetical protein
MVAFERLNHFRINSARDADRIDSRFDVKTMSSTDYSNSSAFRKCHSGNAFATFASSLARIMRYVSNQ